MNRFGLVVSLAILIQFFGVVFSDEVKTPDRFEEDIVAIEQRIAEGKSPEGSILFVGSSSIRKWKLKTSFSDLKAVNHGFGGSYLSDSVHFFDRIVKPVKPTAIVVYAGDNDISAKKSPEAVCSDFQAFVAKVESTLPDCKKVLYISIKPSIKRWALAEQIQKANSLIREECERDPRLQFVDIWPPMLGADGMPRAELLDDDELHLNEQGYVVWTKTLLPFIEPLNPKR